MIKAFARTNCRRAPGPASPAAFWASVSPAQPCRLHGKQPGALGKDSNSNPLPPPPSWASLTRPVRQSLRPLHR